MIFIFTEIETSDDGSMEICTSTSRFNKVGSLPQTEYSGFCGLLKEKDKMN